MCALVISCPLRGGVGMLDNRVLFYSEYRKENFGAVQLSV